MAKPKANEIILQLKAENKILKKKLDESGGSVNKFADKISKSTSSMSGKLKRAGAIILTYFGARAIKSFVNLAGEVDSVSGSFNNLAKGAEGGADGLLKAMQKASKGTVDNLNIMKSSNLAFQLMGDQVAGQLPKMMEVAMAAAKAQGEDVADMFNDIVVASGRKSVMILDNLGISSAVAGKYQEEFAKSLGLTRDKLNETQKSQAFFYAVMKAGGELIEKTGGSTLTLGERLQIIQARFKNAGIQASQTMIPALENLLDAFIQVDATGTSLFNDLVKGAAKFINRIAYAIKIVRIWASDTKKAAKQAKEYAETTVESMNKYKLKVQEAYKADKRANSERGRNWMDMVNQIRKLTNEFESIAKMNEVVRSGAFSHEQVATAMMYVQKLKQANTATAESARLSMSYAEQMVKAREKFLAAERQIEKGGKTVRPTTPFAPTTGGGAETDEEAEKRLLQSKIQYYTYIDEYRTADMLKEQDSYNELLEMKLDFEKDKIAIDEAYRKKQLLAEQDAHKKRIQYDEAVLRAKLKFDSVEYQSAKEVFAASSTLMQSKNRFLFNAGKALAYASAVMSAAEGIAKVWSVWGAYPPIAAVFSGIVSAATGIQIATIRSTRLPNYKKGRVPVFADGYTPADHFPAMIGAREAVINERSTMANLNLLSAINNKPGEKFDSGTVNNIVNVQGSIIDKKGFNQAMIQGQQEIARRTGSKAYTKMGVY